MVSIKTMGKLNGVKHIIAVASGKGGVGKSTVAVNLASALLLKDYRVGLLDGDIYGPSQPLMLGGAEKPQVQEGGASMAPVMKHGLQTMSIGYLIDEKSPMVWRGPMVSKALQQLIFQTQWDDVHYLVVDLPPGTGDAQLTLSQKIPVTGAVIVTTPQELALIDARKAIEMFQKVRVPILGVVENMSVHQCEACGHQEWLFGQDGGCTLAEEYHVPLLGQMPIAREILQQGEAGQPLVLADPQHALSQRYSVLAQQVVESLDLQAAQEKSKFPPIVIEKEG